jgi:hypothetical protein
MMRNYKLGHCTAGSATNILLVKTWRLTLLCSHPAPMPALMPSHCLRIGGFAENISWVTRRKTQQTSYVPETGTFTAQQKVQLAVLRCCAAGLAPNALLVKMKFNLLAAPSSHQQCHNIAYAYHLLGASAKKHGMYGASIPLQACTAVLSGCTAG